MHIEHLPALDLVLSAEDTETQRHEGRARPVCRAALERQQGAGEAVEPENA